ncbi:protein arginine N-methyltransferase 9-like [Thrips palmi]|uniref:Protein arginine N-methyltransferase 9-like n=1 Tax=Thrips palmi TaxID=161013 RepID=A0A6P9ADI1_THRPL|nr:protein arginine N-methyltransferase 9-like [Thrips palmi]
MSDRNATVSGEHSSQINPEAHSPQEIQIALYSRKQAFDYFEKAYFGRALAHLFVALRLIPEWRSELRFMFWQALSGGCKQLADENRLEDTINLRQEASLLYPDDEMILMDLGSIYFKLDDIEKSLKYYYKALELCPTFLPASRAIQSIHNKQVERWHFRMLNDTDRNEAYNRAIAHLIQKGFSSVLDVGTGTGILSLFAAREGADKIWACESNPFMFKIAQSVLAENKLSERVNLINKTSSSIHIPSDIPQKVSLLVTEIFDAGLFGEGVLPTLINAWENLLLPPLYSSEGCDEPNSNQAVVVPFSATVWVAAVQCIDIARRHRLLPSACLCRKTRTTVLCRKSKSDTIDFGAVKLCKFCEAPLDELHQDRRDLNCCLDDASVVLNASEPYTTENLEHVPFGFELLSKPHKLLEINFNSLEELKAYSQNMLREKKMTVLTDTAGSCDALALWFHLNLDNNGTVLSTAPFSEVGVFRGTCWHQAIFPSFTSKPVMPDDSILLNINLKEGALDISMDSNVPGESKRLFSITDNILAFLNNKTWTRAFNAAAVDFAKTVSQIPVTSKKIMDLNPFPVFGLRMLRDCDPSWKLWAKAETNNDKEFIISVARQNSVSESQLAFITHETLDHNVKDEKFEFVCVNVVDASGEFAENLTDTLPILQNMLSSTGKIIPHSLSIECQLIESERLMLESRIVSDENVKNFFIKKFINNFAVDYHLDVPYRSLKCRKLSNPCELLKLGISPLESSTICGEHKQKISIPSIEEGSVTGIIYWVKLYITPRMDPLSTICHDSHCNQVVLFSSLDVKAHQNVNLECQFWYGMLDVKLSLAES